MSLFGRLKNIFTGNPNNSNDNKKKQRHSYIKYDADPNELWEIVGELGDGAFGKVYKARHKVQQIYAALKQVDINDETELEDYSVEIDILNQCRHKNIVGLHEAFFFSGKLWMFIEFCGGGALDSIMVELEKPLTEPQIRYVCREMCEALDFLHQHFVIHRDLKAGNVLLTCEGEVKLADFGVSARNNSYRQKRDTFIGTPYWMAPEVILCETIKDSPYDFKADIWSFGVTLIEFAEIEPPNHEMNPMRVLIKIQKSDSPSLKHQSKWSKDFNDFVAKCVHKDPEQRPTAGDLLQHPFIRDVKGNQPIMELVSEANAEIILEERDLDEDMDEGIDMESRSVATTDIDSDTISTGSNVPKSNEDDNQSDLSPGNGDANKESLPTIVVGRPSGGDESHVSKKHVEPAVEVTDKKPSEQRTGEETTPDDEEPVVLRKKKPHATDAGTLPSIDESSPTPQAGQKKYRTLTKTRKFVVNGEVVMSTVSKVIAPGSTTDRRQQEHQLWKADLRELKILHKQEKKQMHDMEIKFLASIEEQNRKFEQDNTNLMRNADNNYEQLMKQHKQQLDKMAVSHGNEMRNTQKKTKLEQDKDLKAFNEGLKQDLKLLKQEVDLMPKDVRKDLFQQRKKEKEIEHAEKERKFLEQQKESMERVLKRVEDQQRDQKALCEKQFLQLKHQLVRTRDTSLWDAEVSQFKDRHRLSVQQLETKFMLKKQHMMVRHAKEMEQVQRVNSAKEDELLQCHLLENKRLPKIMKNEGKTRALMFKQSLRISVVGLTAEQEKEKIKQFEEVEKTRLKEEETRLKKKHKRQMAELKAKNEVFVKELEQVHAEKRKMLEDNEAQKRKELEEQYEKELNNLTTAIEPKKEALEASFVKEISENERFYANGSFVDHESNRGVISGFSHLMRRSPGPSRSESKRLSARVSPMIPRKAEQDVIHEESLSVSHDNKRPSSSTEQTKTNETQPSVSVQVAPVKSAAASHPPDTSARNVPDVRKETVTPSIVISKMPEKELSKPESDSHKAEKVAVKAAATTAVHHATSEPAETKISASAHPDHSVLPPQATQHQKDVTHGKSPANVEIKVHAVDSQDGGQGKTAKHDVAPPVKTDVKPKDTHVVESTASVSKSENVSKTEEKLITAAPSKNVEPSREDVTQREIVAKVSEESPVGSVAETAKHAPETSLLCPSELLLAEQTSVIVVPEQLSEKSVAETEKRPETVDVKSDLKDEVEVIGQHVVVKEGNEGTSEAPDPEKGGLVHEAKQESSKDKDTVDHHNDVTSQEPVHVHPDNITLGHEDSKPLVVESTDSHEQTSSTNVAHGEKEKVEGEAVHENKEQHTEVNPAHVVDKIGEAGDSVTADSFQRGIDSSSEVTEASAHKECESSPEVKGDVHLHSEPTQKVVEESVEDKGIPSPKVADDSVGKVPDDDDVEPASLLVFDDDDDDDELADVQKDEPKDDCDGKSASVEEKTDVAHECSESTLDKITSREETGHLRQEHATDDSSKVEHEAFVHESSSSCSEAVESLVESQESHDAKEESHEGKEKSCGAEEKSHDAKEELHEKEELHSEKRETHDEKEESCDAKVESCDEKDKSHEKKEESHDEKDKSHDEKEESRDGNDKSHDEKEESHDEKHKSHDEIEESHDEKDKSHDEKDKTLSEKHVPEDAQTEEKCSQPESASEESSDLANDKSCEKKGDVDG